MVSHWDGTGKQMARDKQRAAVIRVMVSDSEKAELRKAAERESMPFGIYVRMAALKLARGELKAA
jgi:hypothetical protein